MTTNLLDYANLFEPYLTLDCLKGWIMIRVSIDIRGQMSNVGFNGKAQSRELHGGIEVGLLQLSRPMKPFFEVGLVGDDHES